MILYADASVIAALALGEPASAQIETRSETADDILVSDFGIGKAVSAVSIALRLGRLKDEDANAIVDRLVAGFAGWAVVACETIDISRAVQLVRRFDLALRMPDAIHVAIAERLDARLFSGDERQLSAAETIGLRIERLTA